MKFDKQGLYLTLVHSLWFNIQFLTELSLLGRDIVSDKSPLNITMSSLDESISVYNFAKNHIDIFTFEQQEDIASALDVIDAIVIDIKNNIEE